MSRDVNQSRCRSSRLQDVLARGISHKQLRMWNDAAQSSQLLQNQGSILIRNSHQQCRARGIYVLLRANGIDARARRIGNRVVIDEIALAVEQCMKRHIMQRAVRYEEKMAQIEPISNWTEQLVV